MIWRAMGTAPKGGTLIDLWVDGERLPDCLWWSPDWAPVDAHGWRQKYAETGKDSSFLIDGEPTHWMPGPAGPAGVKGGE